MAVRNLNAGDTLFEIDDDGEVVFVVVRGRLEIIAKTHDGGDVVVGHLGPDDVVGEITAVIGGQRTATVRAIEPTEVRELAGDAFDAWLAEDAERGARIAAEARRRMDRTRVAKVVAELVGQENPALIDEMTDAVEWTSLEAGTALFEQGDIADSAYILVSGQMRVMATEDDEIVLDTRIGRGDLLGEMGVIEQAPRMATARAIRDCTLARIPKATFEQLTAAHPALMLPLVRKVIERVGDRRIHKPHVGNIAVFVAAPNVSTDLVAELAEEVSRFGSTLHLDAERVATFLDRRGIANAATGSVADSRLGEFLHEVDVAHRWLLLECDRTLTDWSRRALRGADRVVLVTSANPDSPEASMVAEVRSLLEATGDYDLWAIQLNGDHPPSGGAATRSRAGASRVLQLTRGDEAGRRRIARLITGNGTGVAFSGGGGRSYGQLGAIRAMAELGIDIDAVSGTSMGSVIASVVAIDGDLDQVVETAPSKFDGQKLLDYTVPLVSLMKAQRITKALEAEYGDTEIEDLHLPYVCISTNLTQASIVEHRDGNLVDAIRASIALPGVFPPVSADGDLLVDGGVLENLPARPLRADPAIATVIAIDVAPPGGPSARAPLGRSLSGFSVLKDKLRRRRTPHPAIANTVIASMLVGSSRARIESLSNSDIDLWVSLNLKGIKLLDLDAANEAAARGYEDSLPQLKTWLDAGGSTPTSSIDESILSAPTLP